MHKVLYDIEYYTPNQIKVNTLKDIFHGCKGNSAMEDGIFFFNTMPNHHVYQSRVAGGE